MRGRVDFLVQKQMANFLQNKTQYYVDRLDELAILMAYVTGDHENLTRIEGKKNESGTVWNVERKQPVMLVTGPSGNGKTMLLAKFVLHLEVIHSLSSDHLFRYRLGDNERKVFVILLLY